ncbi:MAG: hypothetical protein OXH85_03825 [Truepera sp.]|nr:hypothetical protein [Truepera sp.]
MSAPEQASDEPRATWHRLLPLVAVLVGTFVLAILVQGFVERVIVEPALYLTWIVSLLLRSVPEPLFWLLFVLLVLVVAVRSLRLWTVRGREGRRAGETVYGPVGRRARLLQNATSPGYSRWRLARELGRLAGELAWPGRGFSAERQRAWLTDPSSGIPPEIAAYFLAGLDPYRPVHLPWYRRGVRRAPSPLDLDPGEVMGFLEELQGWGSGP